MARRIVGRPVVAAILLLAVLGGAAPASAAVWYLGAFTGSSPLDDADCGNGKGAHPAPHPCATLAYWTANRISKVAAGDVVRITGTFGPAASGYHCIIPRSEVIYEGRTADDEQPESWNDAIVDAAQTLAYPCHGGAISCRGDSACLSFSHLTLRYLTLANANGPGGEGNQLQPANTVQIGLVIDHVRFTGSQASGLQIGSGVSIEDNPCGGVRNIKNITIRDSQFDHNTLAGAQAGLWLTCTDGGTIERCSAFDNRGAEKTAEECNDDPDSAGCDGRNGFHIGGWINGTLADSIAHDNGYYNYNFSGNGPAAVCDALTHDLLVTGCSSYNAAEAHFSFSHCNHDITVRNSYAWGHGLAVNQYACAYKLNFYNNTFWSDKGLQLFTNCRECDFRNNIFHCDSSSDCIYVDFASRNALTTWRNNVVVNDGSGTALSVYSSQDECVGTPGGSCDCPGRQGVIECPNSDPQSPGCPSPWKDSVERHFTNAQLDEFVTDAMFGAETGSGDKWGAAPAIVDASATSESALHLRSNDTIARDGGVTVASAQFGDPPIDWDGDRRPVGSTWDAGADEVAATTDTCEADLDICSDELATCSTARDGFENGLNSCQSALTGCQATSATCNTALGTCSNALETSQTTLASTQASLTSTQASLATCQSDLAAATAATESCATDLAACRALPLLQDADGDGHPDVNDRCAATAAGASTDTAGCSQAQFCAGFEAVTSNGKSRCKKADWDNDEPLMKTKEADCRVDKGSRGPADDRCVPASS